MNHLLDFLAQAASQPAPAAGTQPSGLEMFVKQILPLFLLIGVFWWIMARGRTKEQKRFEDMLSSLKRGDRVQTIGGMLGSVVDVRDNEVVLKVDESNNVKVRFHRSAIKEVFRDAPAPAADKK